MLAASPNETLRDILAAYLSGTGAESEIVGGLAKALEALDRTPDDEQGPAIVIIDEDFPEAQCKQLHARTEALGGFHCFVLTSRNTPGGRDGDDYRNACTPLAKPLTQRRVLQALAVATGRSGSDDAAHARRRADRERNLSYIAPSLGEATELGILILVAEDNPTNQAVISLLLKRLGLAAEYCDDGMQAVEKLKHKTYGLLLTDCHMPRMNGYQLTTWVREREETEHRDRMPIIALTADAIIGTEERCLKSGMDGYLSKPVSSRQLESAILHFLPTAADHRHLDHSHNDKPVPERQEAPSSPVLDLNYLRDVFDDDEMIPSLLQDFVSTTASLIDSHHAAMAEGDFASARESAHSAKGAARMAGAVRLGDLCESIQMTLMEENHDLARQHAERLPSTFQDVCDSVEEIVNRHASSQSGSKSE